MKWVEAKKKKTKKNKPIVKWDCVDFNFKQLFWNKNKKAYVKRSRLDFVMSLIFILLFLSNFFLGKR